MRKTHVSIRNFWSFVRVSDPENPDSCWVWTGSRDNNGYPLYAGMLARRVAAVIYTRSIPGVVTMHCKNVLCVRQEHVRRIGPPGGEIAKTKKSKLTGRSLKIPVYFDENLRRRVLEFRVGDYRIEDIAKHVGTQPRIVKQILRLGVLYDILEDMRVYSINNMPVPIEPDRRKI